MASEGDTLSQSEAFGAKPQFAPYLFLEIECERPAVGPARHLLAEVECVRLCRGHSGEANYVADHDDRRTRESGGAPWQQR